MLKPLISDVTKSKILTTFRLCTSISTRLRTDTGETEVRSESDTMTQDFRITLGEVMDRTHNYRMRFVIKTFSY